MGRNKFGAIKIQIGGISFDSKREAARYQSLLLLERAGEIRNLRPHPKYPLANCHVAVKTKGGKSNRVYTADAEYLDVATHELVTEDVKGVLTEAAALRIAVFEAIYSRKVKIIK